MIFNQKSSEVWMSYGRGLGDVIHSLMVYLNKSIDDQKTTRVATWYPKHDRKKTCGWKWQELYPLINSPGEIELTEDTPTKKHHWKEGGMAKCYPTKTVWNIKSFDSGKIAYQFDGKSHKEKNFSSPEKEELIISKIKKLGYEPVKLGSSNSLEEAMLILSQCKMFIGIDSGFSHFAHCVGLPVILARNGYEVERITHLHHNKHFILTHNETDTIIAIEELAEKSMEWYLEKCYFKNTFTNFHSVL